VYAIALALCAAAPAAAKPAPVAKAAKVKKIETAPVPAARAGDALRHAVVSLKITGQNWDYRSPWNKQSPWTASTNALVVQGRRLLAAGSTVGNRTLVEVQKNGDEKRYLARVELVDYEGPLTLLAVDDEEFWSDLAPVPIAADVPTEGEVTVHRWLTSGQFESARATVRQVRAASHGTARPLLLTLDVTTNIGGAGWSEAVVRGGAVVGLATSKGDDVLLAIAAPVLGRFVRDAASGTHRSFAIFGFSWQKLLNPAMRAQLGLVHGEGGVMVQRVRTGASADGALEPGDVVLSVDGVPVDPSGQIVHSKYGKLSFAVLANLEHRPGDRVDVRVVRGGERRTVSMLLRAAPPETDRVPAYRMDKGPDYAVRGGLVFQELSVPYLGLYGEWRRAGPLRLVVEEDLEGFWPAPDGHHDVVLTHVLADPCNVGYQGYRDFLVESVNGVPARSLADVRTGFTRPEGRFHVVTLAPGQGAGRLVLDAAEAEASVARVRAQFGVEDPR